jgi:sarcosine oxidase delta subunit
MARKNRVSQVLDCAAAAAIKAAAVQLSKLSDEDLAEVEQQLDIAYLYANKDGVPYEDWKHTAHYSTFTYAWVLAVLVAVGERRRRRLIEQARALEQVGA